MGVFGGEGHEEKAEEGGEEGSIAPEQGFGWFEDVESVELGEYDAEIDVCAYEDYDALASSVLGE